MLKFNSIKTRLIFYLILGLIPVFAVLLYLGENYARDILYKNATFKAKSLALEASRKIENLTLEIAEKPKEISSMFLYGLSDINSIKQFMKDNVEGNKLIYGMALAFSLEYSPNRDYYCLYYCKKDNNVLFKNLIPPKYDYLNYDWFKKPINKKRNMWSAPYFDKGGGNIWMSTYSSLIKNKNGKIIGVATADVSIEFLSKIINRIRILKSGGAFLFSSNGSILAPINERTVEKESVSKILSIGKKHILTRSILLSNKDFNKINIDGKEYLIYYTPIKNTDWTIGVVFLEDELFAPIERMRVYAILLSVLGIFIAVSLILFVSKKVTEDIVKINGISLQIAQGDFDVEIPKSLSDESGSIARALDTMQKSLKEFMKDVEEKAKIDQELELAKRIQSAFIPNRLKLKMNGFEFSAMSVWANQVGGDFYGVKKIKNDKILFYLGDVSGKGISAVLYAVIAKTMIDVLIRQTDSLSEIIGFLNNYLASITKHNTFATMFIGIVDKKNGVIEFCNAGHIPPMIFRDGALSTPILNGNVPIGILADFNYKISSLSLNKMDGMLIYSDGITDAMNDKEEEFGEERIIDAILESVNKNSDVVSILENKLYKFINDRELYDDTTLLWVGFN